MTSQTVTVVNQLGMHARAAAKFVHLATRFEARVKVAREMRDHGRNAIWVASDLLRGEKTSA